MKKIVCAVLLCLTLSLISSTFELLAFNPSTIDDEHTTIYYDEDISYLYTQELGIHDDQKEKVTTKDTSENDEVQLPYIESMGFCLFNCYKSIYNKDYYEDNNSKSDAYYLGQLSTGGGTAVSTTRWANIHDTGSKYATDSSDRDVDHFTFEISEKYRFEILLSSIELGQDYDMKFYKVNKNGILPDTYSLLKSSTNGSNYNEVINSYIKDSSTIDYISGGKYLIEVYSYRGVSNDLYSLKITLSPYEDDYENNDTFNTATSFSLSDYFNVDYRKTEQQMKGTIHHTGDIDFYTFTILKDEANMHIFLRDIPTDRDYDMRLYNSNFNIVKSSINSSNQDEYMNVNLKRGTYYIRIASFRGYSPDHKYTLTIDGVEYNPKDFRYDNGDYVSYGVKWTYNSVLSTYLDHNSSNLSRDYTAYYRYQFDTTQYLYQQIYLYNFNNERLQYTIGVLDGILLRLQEGDTVLESIKNQGTLSILFGGIIGGYTVLQAVKSATMPWLFILEVGIAGSYIVIDVTNAQYNINLLTHYRSLLYDVYSSQNKGIKIEIFKKAFVDDVLIYKFSVWDYGSALEINPTVIDYPYSNYRVYGTLSYVTYQHNTYTDGRPYSNSQLNYLNMMFDLGLTHRKS